MSFCCITLFYILSKRSVYQFPYVYVHFKFFSDDGSFTGRVLFYREALKKEVQQLKRQLRKKSPEKTDSTEISDENPETSAVSDTKKQHIEELKRFESAKKALPKKGSIPII